MLIVSPYFVPAQARRGQPRRPGGTRPARRRADELAGRHRRGRRAHRLRCAIAATCCAAGSSCTR
ncbi:MAG: hypothetical protein MZV70_43180 [Desulfobacterales bacterium]|nr:hypothetical protein [Desulfobacterales bacterium]